MKDRLRSVRASGGYERWEHHTDKPLMVLALLFVVVLVLPYLVDLTAAQSLALAVIDVAFWLAFAVDYGTKPRSTDRHRGSVRLRHVITVSDRVVRGSGGLVPCAREVVGVSGWLRGRRVSHVDG